ncbi:hypothetical protein E2P81_ATG00259 [Venturia nashicola]|nr:hypothetical protein E2P81_ATG00259 [Venturia nashicola]
MQLPLQIYQYWVSFFRKRLLMGGAQEVGAGAQSCAAGLSCPSSTPTRSFHLLKLGSAAGEALTLSLNDDVLGPLNTGGASAGASLPGLSRRNDPLLTTHNQAASGGGAWLPGAGYEYMAFGNPMLLL